MKNSNGMNPKSAFQYIDIHSHVNFATFDPVRGVASNGVDGDRDEVISRALQAGVAMINVGTQKDTSQKAIEIAEKYPEGIYAIIGVHPIHTAKSFHDVKELGEIPPAEDGNAPFTKGRITADGFTSRGEVFDYEYYKKLAVHPKVVGIGECGLDYYRIKNNELGIMNENEVKKKQEDIFREQIELSIEIGKPLMLHIRDAYSEAFDILNSYFILHNSKLRANLHFFAGTIADAKKFLELGFTFSFTGVVSFAKNYEEIIRYLPIDRILSETDSPYVAPVPYRGKRNEPLFVREVVKHIARIRNEDEEKVRVQILKNAEQLFGISL